MVSRCALPPFLQPNKRRLPLTTGGFPRDFRNGIVASYRAKRQGFLAMRLKFHLGLVGQFVVGALRRRWIGSHTDLRAITQILRKLEADIDEVEGRHERQEDSDSNYRHTSTSFLLLPGHFDANRNFVLDWNSEERG